ncbi:Prolyl 4-hydroxylase subunit alpha-3 [Tetrabaena socialis]|uniref:Prolyl 4-hydroxylase subunit alpha-3 n=1 Tax=Tetrabaena socialis TaxID=47790 RepID=A0A2J8A6F1_9CHLO|nr:Prolyl 4-hydroxylase subunit alpha-3 [Tetrabaena socialis]|eukprot:PNH08112.1 Prolyl 4-hydroxylase subunit alpha-3 [Tetrabaena socialis]
MGGPARCTTARAHDPHQHRHHHHLPAGAFSDGDERLIGWQGEQPAPSDKSSSGDGVTRTTLHSANSSRPAWIQNISWKPRAFVYHNFLSDQEARHIIDLAHAQMKRSTVVGSKSEGVVDNIRTSYGTFLRRNQDPVIAAIEERLSLWSHLPVSHQEDMQVLRYGPTNKYGAHIDGLERVASVLIYLVAPEDGGETAFIDRCSRAPTGLAADAEEYKRALTEPYETLPDPGICTDLHKMCETWASAGECKNNAGYMTGSNAGLGSCRLACKDCEECANGDTACYERNRESGGFLIFDEKELKGL